jgi:hypothetical protein
MNSTMSAPSPTPPCGWKDLPIELVVKIVSLAAAQDERFRQWLDSPERRELATELKKSHSTYGRSLSALFRCNKKLATLAAPHHFKVH